ncbi:ROK family protein [Pontibacter silvestris]|uniref:ROK family protein n=1 Tax=Pontibacter silvestris TaxID=2305183 RepID=A0ABW4WSK0_9BACT|nr:ROK family protein [Pontibacter silvestris]MCC9137831.1 ROK family protein [Pontibacter silvestris]
MYSSIVLGVDIGGSHITAALIDLELKNILPNTLTRERVNAQGTVEEIITTWANVIEMAFAKSSGASKRIGIAIPGPFEYEKGISLMQNQNKYDALYGVNVKELLGEKLGISKDDVNLVNDAGCFLKGEVFAGAAVGAGKAIGLTLGTGLGTARYADGIAADADLWNAPLKSSIAEEYISTRGLVNTYKELSGLPVKDVKELAGLYKADPYARQAFEVFADNLSLFLASFIKADNPEVVVVGGNIANAWELFIPIAEEKLAEQEIYVPLRRAVLGEEAALIGAASSWSE